jgi:hypothetical protein
MFNFYDVMAKQGTQFYDGEWSPYPKDTLALHTLAEVPPDLHVKIVRGVRPGDAIFATANVVSERFVRVLRECQATGFDVFPVPLIKKGAVVASFLGLRVFGRGGPWDSVRSNADMHEGGVAFGYSAIYMDESQWDGSDVFFIPGLGVTLFVTERVANAMKRAKLLNVKLTVNTECSWGTRADYSHILDRVKKVSQQAHSRRSDARR